MSELSGYFVTGTDTGIGKTVITLGLMHVLQGQGRRVAGMKPVASGCERTAAGLRNGDALQLQRQTSVALDYERVNPYAFEPAIAPHIAAARAGVQISLDAIQSACLQLAGQVDCVVVEGVGGWAVPLNRHEMLPDLARLLDLPVILVVGMRLGCLNHALLSAAAIERAGLQLAGWVANCPGAPPECLDENISTLKSRISAPLLGVVPELAEPVPGQVAQYLATDALHYS